MLAKLAAMDRKTERLADSALFALATIVGIILGYKPLVDPDIGWHLAGGLSIIEFGKVPSSDYLSAVDRVWWCYSWLAEVLFAAWFKLGGFFALQLLQTLTIVCSVWVLIMLIRSTSTARRNLLAEAAAFGSVVFLAAPIWHLRPQLLSYILFCALLSMREKHQLRLAWAIGLTAVWANIHVYWILVPLLVGLDRLLVRNSLAAAVRDSAACVGAALLSPYLLHQYRGLIDYAFFHDTANELIKEFRSITSAGSFLLVIYLLICVGCAVSWKSIKAKEPSDSVVLFVLLALAALLRLKFIPLFGAAAAPILTRSVLPRFAKMEAAVEESSKTSNLLLAAAVLAFCLVSLATLRPAQPLDDEQLSLLDAAALLSSQPHDEQKIYPVLNDFNHGGWLELGFWLQRDSRARPSSFRPTIDGRTLVMGPSRLNQYKRLLNSEISASEAAAAWAATSAILPEASGAALNLIDAGWTKLGQVQSMVVLCDAHADVESNFCLSPISSLSPN